MAALSFTLSAAVAATLPLLLARPPHVLPCSLHGHIILCPVDVGASRVLQFAIDTGTERTLLDSSVAFALGVTRSAIPVEALGRTVDASVATVPTLRLGAREFRNLTTTVCSLRTIAHAGGPSLSGIVGIDVIGRSALTMDFKRGRVAVGHVGTLPRRERFTTTRRGFPVVEAKIGRRRVRLIVDTGAPGVVLFGSGPVPPVSIPTASIEGSGVGGSVALSRVGRRVLRIGGTRVETDVLLLVQGATTRAAYEADGLIGPRALAASLVTLDFERQELAWSP
jgi:hypothetical protein